MTDTYTADTAAPDEAALAPVDTGVSEPKKYTGDLHGIQEAAADHQRDLDEKKKAEPSPERVAKAKQKLSERVAERMGFESADLDQVTWSGKDEEKLTERKAAKGLAEFRRQKEAGLQEILAEEDTAVADEQAATRASEEWQQQQATQEREWEATQQHQRQQEVRQQTVQLSETEHALRGRLQQHQAAALHEAPAITELARLVQTDPDRARQLAAEAYRANPQEYTRQWERFQQLDQQYRSDAQQAQLIGVQRQQEQQANFQEYGRAEDAKFRSAHPEVFADRHTQWEAAQNVREYMLEKRGLSEDRLRELWTSDPTFRSAEAQALIYDAAQHYRAEKAMREARPVAHPQPQRPGVSTGRMNGTSGENLRAIDTAGSLRKQLDVAREITLARRRAAAKGRR